MKLVTLPSTKALNIVLRIHQNLYLFYNYPFRHHFHRIDY